MPSKKSIWKEQEEKCIYCNRIIPFDIATIEHKIPRSVGGSNDRDNLAVACSECNSAINKLFCLLTHEAQLMLMQALKDGHLPKFENDCLVLPFSFRRRSVSITKRQPKRARQTVQTYDHLLINDPGRRWVRFPD